MNIRLYAVILVVLTPALLFAQSSDDEPNDQRDWGRASQYQSLVSGLGDTQVATFPIPVLLGVEQRDLTKNFGDPRGGGTRSHEGLDMMAMQGTPISSPTDAVVTRTGNGTNSGIYVRTANPGGEQFVYMHLSEIARGIVAGKKVVRGEIIGYVGNTGNASGGAAHLHFETRKNGAQDPYPRLTSTFTLQERMTGVAQALERTANTGLAQLLTTKYKATFEEARAAGVALPPQIEALMGSSSTPAPTSGTPTTPPTGFGNLIYGETHSDIAAMQRVLAAQATGSSGIRLKNTGATGYFGPLTQAALKEFQTVNGLAATGVVDAATYAKLFEAPTGAGVPPAPLPPSGTFTRDLELGMSGTDVRALQIFLNTHSAIIATSGTGSPGQESDYFGALTRAALMKYQAAHTIAPAAGYFGPKTRAFIAAQ